MTHWEAKWAEHLGQAHLSSRSNPKKTMVRHQKESNIFPHKAPQLQYCIQSVGGIMSLTNKTCQHVLNGLRESGNVLGHFKVDAIRALKHNDICRAMSHCLARYQKAKKKRKNKHRKGLAPMALQARFDWPKISYCLNKKSNHWLYF